MKLDKWLHQQGLTQPAFAELLTPPVSQSLVSQWITGATRITLDRALEIADLTKGGVTAKDCAAMFNEKTAA